MPVPPDLFDLTRFIDAQAADYATALAELHAGRKRSHWMWYIFPQIDGLGFSAMSKRYAIKGVAEANAYLAHPLLGLRLSECFNAVLAVRGKTANDIFGSPDDLKLRSSATLFAATSPATSVFHQVLAQYFAGQNDPITLTLLQKPEPDSIPNQR